MKACREWIYSTGSFVLNFGKLHALVALP